MAEGGFSRVYLARDHATRQPLALKQMLCQSKEAIKEAYKEVEVSSLPQHIVCVWPLLAVSACQRHTALMCSLCTLLYI